MMVKVLISLLNIELSHLKKKKIQDHWVNTFWLQLVAAPQPSSNTNEFHSLAGGMYWLTRTQEVE